MTGSALPSGIKVLSIGELTREVKVLLEEGFRGVWVSGEISNLTRPASGHLYLTLKDRQAQIRTIIWRSTAMRLRFELRNGLEVIVRGRLSVYEPRGEYQFVVDEIQPKGLGAAEVALRQLKEKLFKLGFFDSGRKKKLPAYPRRVALVTSPKGAAVRDMVEILGRRWPAVEIWVCPVRVQGDGAAEEIAAAVRLLNRCPGIEVMIVGRGGGSSEDLWAFNMEIVARAIYESRIPVVSAVGHEIDLTIADLVADLRALTPSEAAEISVPHREELLDSLRGLEGQIRTLLMQRLERAGKKLHDLAERRCFRLPLEPIREHERRLDESAGRLHRSMRQRLFQLQERMQAQAAQLESLSPLNVLARGYSLSRREADQAVLRDPAQVRPGERIVTFVQHGKIHSRVEETEQAADSSASRWQG
jgi:exodeoxyribonuclease VII large subunit